jgi:hypothetical protein
MVTIRMMSDETRILKESFIIDDDIYDIEKLIINDDNATK